MTFWNQTDVSRQSATGEHNVWNRLKYSSSGDNSEITIRNIDPIRIDCSNSGDEYGMVFGYQASFEILTKKGFTYKKKKKGILVFLLN